MAEINITPFTDVILVLLIIFMITTPLIYQANIKVDLPDARSAKAPAKISQIQSDITITREGTVYLDDKLVTRKELREQVSALKQNNNDLSVTLRSDKFVRFQEIVSILDILTELGITKLNIAAAGEQ